MKKRKTTIILILIVVVVIALLLGHMPEQIEGTMTVSTSTGETAEIDVNILYYSNLVLPPYVKGTISVDGVEYTDQYTLLKKIPSVTDNRLFPSDWWKTKESVPYNMTFVRSDCTDVVSAHLNRINVLDVVLNKGICEIHYMYTDESNQIDTEIKGISFWGPAQDAEDAKQIAEFFGYKTP